MGHSRTPGATCSVRLKGQCMSAGTSCVLIRVQCRYCGLTHTKCTHAHSKKKTICANSCHVGSAQNRLASSAPPGQRPKLTQAWALQGSTGRPLGQGPGSPGVTHSLTACQPSGLSSQSSRHPCPRPAWAHASSTPTSPRAGRCPGKYREDVHPRALGISLLPHPKVTLVLLACLVFTA